MPLDPNSVDVIGFDDLNGTVTLVIADDLDWSNEAEHIFQLQEKLNAYATYVASLEMAKNHPKSLAMKPRIHVALLHEPPGSAHRFFSSFRNSLSNIGIDLTYKHSHFNSPPHAI